MSTSSRRSFLGSVKDKLSRWPSNASSKSANEQQQRHHQEPSPISPTLPVDLPANNPAQSRGRSMMNTNPFSNPSPATRRPPPTEAPPAYTETPDATTGPTLPPSPGPYTQRASSPAPSGGSAITFTTPEDPYAFLTSFDTVFIIDDSGSMAGRSWREVKEVLRQITPICTAHDSDGIDIYFLNNSNPDARADPATGKPAGGYRNITTAAAVEDLFARVRPTAATPTGTRINAVLKPYLRHYEQRIAAAGGDPDATDVKPLNMIVITDGVPTDDPEAVLISVAKKLDRLEAPPYQVGVQFFQVGNEPGARDALRQLDDSLEELVDGGIRDIVDTVTFDVVDGRSRQLTADGILKAVLGAVVKRLDRQQQGEGRRSRTHLAP